MGSNIVGDFRAVEGTQKIIDINATHEDVEFKVGAMKAGQKVFEEIRL
jgi:hypothetical protein